MTTQQKEHLARLADLFISEQEIIIVPYNGSCRRIYQNGLRVNQTTVAGDALLFARSRGLTLWPKAKKDFADYIIRNAPKRNAKPRKPQMDISKPPEQ